MKGYIFFSSGKSWISKVILWFSGRWSHTGVFYDDKVIFESDIHQQLSLWENNLKQIKNYQIFKVCIDDDTRSIALDALISEKYGQPYAVLQFLWTGVLLLLSKIGIKLTWFPKAFRKYDYCSELVYDYLYKLEDIRPILEEIDKDYFSPTQLWEIMCLYPNEFELIGENFKSQKHRDKFNIRLATKAIPIPDLEYNKRR